MPVVDRPASSRPGLAWGCVTSFTASLSATSTGAGSWQARAEDSTATASGRSGTSRVVFTRSHVVRIFKLEVVALKLE